MKQAEWLIVDTGGMRLVIVLFTDGQTTVCAIYLFGGSKIHITNSFAVSVSVGGDANDASLVDHRRCRSVGSSTQADTDTPVVTEYRAATCEEKRNCWK